MLLLHAHMLPSQVMLRSGRQIVSGSADYMYGKPAPTSRMPPLAGSVESSWLSRTSNGFTM
jgi:hypothetical protein